ncbi:hypothetical protein ACFQMA_17330 [Halosimplex aquaticum]|uniref:DUF7260 domain-containing protein n=1 Tax=Halosimplex aquaticum TaxID=3026162 RepID=A0ABD5Y2H6_9EURY|nr:hypothetical protein [Halosimplex aquaticum]
MTASNSAPLRTAIDIVDREIEYATDERAAFDRFRARLSNVDPTPPSATSATAGSGVTTMPAAVSTGGDPGPAASLRAVRTAYRETVMDVPHYEAEYGDTLRASLASEFCPEVATQVVDGRQLTPPLYRALWDGSESASDDRERFRRALERERESLVDIDGALAECDRRLAEIEPQLDDASTARLSRLDDRLADLEATCADLADERQSLVHGRPDVHLSGVAGTSLVTFLYGEFDARCPALSAIADRLQRIRDDRTRCLR